MTLSDPQFPPLLTGHGVNAPLHPFEHACKLAAERSLGAGDLVWARGHDHIKLAIILEPEVVLGTALQMAPMMFVAIADSLGALMPPRTGVYLRWPDTILVNAARCGDVTFAAPNRQLDQTPDWLVVAVSLCLNDARRSEETGYRPDQTTLFDEGGHELDRNIILQSVAAHFLTWLNIWLDDGFAPVHARLIGLIEGHEEAVPMAHLGQDETARVLGLDDEMRLMIKTESGNTSAVALADKLVVPGDGA